VDFAAGAGSKVHLGVGDWMEGDWESFANLFVLVSNKCIRLGLLWVKGGNVPFEVSFKRVWCQYEEPKFDLLNMLLACLFAEKR